jgi:uncharacterized protein (DUF433 family)
MEPTKHIEITPGVCSGRPRVAGTRIRVENVVRWTEQGMLPDEIVASYPQLTPADVHSALAFYFDNRDEIERQMREDSEFINAMMAKQGCRLTPASVGKEVDDDPLPSR